MLFLPLRGLWFPRERFLSAVALWLALEPHAYAGSDNMDLAEILFSGGAGFLINPVTILRLKAVNNGGE